MPYYFQVQLHSFFPSKCIIFRRCLKKYLIMSGRSKNHTLKGSTSPYNICLEVPPLGVRVLSDGNRTVVLVFSSFQFQSFSSCSATSTLVDLCLEYIVELVLEVVLFWVFFLLPTTAIPY